MGILYSQGQQPPGYSAEHAQQGISDGARGKLGQPTQVAGNLKKESSSTDIVKVPIHQQLAQNKNKKFNNMLNTGNNIVHGSNLPGLTSNNNVIIPSNNAGSYAPQLDHYKLISSPFILRKSQQQQQAIFEISQKIREMNLKLIIKGDQI